MYVVMRWDGISSDGIRFSSQILIKMKTIIEIIKDHCDNAWGVVLIICVSICVIGAISLMAMGVLMSL